MQNIRLGHAVSPFNHRMNSKRGANPSCQTGGFYKSPSNGATVDAANPLNITWDTTCLTTDAVDIYLYNPGAQSARIHMWDTVKYADGSYAATLEPAWWNSSSKATLQLSIVEHGTQPFLSPFPAGPVFTATSSASGASASSSAGASDTVTQVYGLGKPHHGLAPGKTAAAVLMPLLLVIALLAAAYIKIKRARNAEKRKRWSEAVDKRMSTISTDWKSMSAAGASAAIRQSMAGSVTGDRTRNSSFSFGAIRPASTVAVEGGQAGVGARGYASERSINTTSEPQMRMRASSYSTGERVSRVSFADDPRPRPSGESRRTVASRAFHTGFVPPLPTRSDSDLRTTSFYDANAATGEMSPVQREGAMEIGADEIRARISGEKQEAQRQSVIGDDVMPALNMMRDGEEYLFPAPPTPPTPVHHAPTSPVAGMMPMQPMPASVMSPDDMLRAYATRSPAPNTVTFPAPAVNYNGNGMRTLYSPTTPASAHGSQAEQLMPHSHSPANPYRMNWEDEDEANAYGGTA